MEQIILSGISLVDFENNLKKIVENEVQKIVSEIPKPVQEPEFLTRKETAKILGITLPTLHSWTTSGTIPAHRIGTRVRYKKSDIHNSLKSIETLKYRRA